MRPTAVLDGTLIAMVATGLPSCRMAPSTTAQDHVHATEAGEWSGDPALPPKIAAQADTPVRTHGWVLHFGDSFVEAWFEENLRPHFHDIGAGYVTKGVKSTYTTSWAYDPDLELDSWLAKGPSLVIVTLGANELFNPQPETHAHVIEVLSRKVARASKACVWTAPPTWKKDTGIIQIIHDHCAPCLFFDSEASLGGPLTLDERERDHIHPNDKGGARWADVFWTWLEDHRAPGDDPLKLVPFEPRERGALLTGPPGDR